MKDLVTDIKSLQEETLKNLQSSKQTTLSELINQISKISVYFVLKMDLRTCLRSENSFFVFNSSCLQKKLN